MGYGPNELALARLRAISESPRFQGILEGQEKLTSDELAVFSDAVRKMLVPIHLERATLEELSKATQMAALVAAHTEAEQDQRHVGQLERITREVSLMFSGHTPQAQR